jgi:hypothetical protein
MLGIRTLARFAVLVAAASVAVASVAAYATAGPSIKAHPASAMVNTTISLRGRDFQPDATLLIVECGARRWVVMATPCDSNNTVSVATDQRGRFTTRFVLELCPRVASPTPPATREQCFIGHPQLNGIDTDTLLGAKQVTVTYP